VVSRPSRAEIDPAALRLLERHGEQILATARRYSATPEDAEDAYQRAFEILLTKAPTASEAELVPWLKTVVKHEAFAIHRQRERATPTTHDGELEEPGGREAAAHDQAERYERLHQGAETLRRLKPQEVRCLRLKAEGYSYNEICELTGWTYTKVNRCLTEGRKAFLRKLEGIEGGAECERLAPLVSALADGEASAADLRTLRPHLRTCLTCRARLRAFRATPARVAALAPLTAAGVDAGPLRGWAESLLGAAQHRAASWGERAQTAAELATGHKLGAVAASTAALAGGGATVDRLADRERLPREADRPAQVRRVEEKPAEAPPTPEPTPEAGSGSASGPSSSAPPPPSPSPDPAAEFAPEPAPANGSGPDPQPSGGEFGGGGAIGGGAAGGGSTEFGP
jgi:RNA polymerase sigma factor (sigma-70 family)